MIGWLNGDIVEPERVPALDSYAPGSGFFETMRSVDGHVLHADLHLRRAAAAMQHFGFDFLEEFRGAMAALAGDDLRTRVQVTAGHVAAVAQPFVPYGEDVLRDGIDVDVSLVQLLPGPSPGFKPLAFQPYTHAKASCVLDDALITNGDAIVEATSANVIARIGDQIYSPGPADGAVDGITRQRIITDAAGAIPLDQLEEIDEMVLANTTGVRPVRLLCGRRLTMGAWTRDLQERA